MLQNLVSVDMKVCSLQLKQKSTAGVSNGILQNFRKATFENNFGRLLLKRKQTALILATYCERYPHAVPFLWNKIPYSLLKTPKRHAV